MGEKKESGLCRSGAQSGERAQAPEAGEAAAAAADRVWAPRAGDGVTARSGGAGGFVARAAEGPAVAYFLRGSLFLPAGGWLVGGRELRGDSPGKATAVDEGAVLLGAVGIGEKWAGQRDT